MNMESRPRIKRLDSEIVNRIAAGEVVKRPASALKELMENSLDANSTLIQVVARGGGLKFLQIQDNGFGIAKDDLGIVCERFTTSKLETFDGLRSINTYGFRGEALCSISLVSALTIVTKTADERCAYQVRYLNGKMVDSPLPCGGNQGTRITVENLFYNVPTRQKMFKNLNEEYTKIKEVVMSYSIHNASVSFCLKKHGQDSYDVKTLLNSTCIDNIRLFYGREVSRDLMEANETDETLKLKFHILTSSISYHSSQMTFLLFINHRLVEAGGLKKQLDLLYSEHLPEGTHPFIYLSLEMSPENVDVNVHPTKNQVFYLHEDVINNKIKAKVKQMICSNIGSNYIPMKSLSRSSLNNISANDSFLGKTKVEVLYPYEKVRVDSSEQKIDSFLHPLSTLDGRKLNNSSKNNVRDFCGENSSSVLNETLHFDSMLLQETRNVESKKLVVENFSGMLNKIIPEEPNVNSVVSGFQYDQKSLFNEGTHQELCTKDLIVEGSPSVANSLPVLKMTMNEDSSNLMPNTERLDLLNKDFPKIPSVDNIDIETNCEMFLLQHSTNKFDVSSGPMLGERREFSLTSLENLRKKVVEDSNQELKSLLRSGSYIGCVRYKCLLIHHDTCLYACDVQSLCETFFYQFLLSEFGNFGVISLSPSLSLKQILKSALKSECAESDIQILVNRLRDSSEMLEDYFSLKIDEYGNLKSIPWLLERYYPSLSGLPELILKLATEVKWNEEMACIQGICTKIAHFYSQIPSKNDSQTNPKEWNWVLQHILFPKIKRFLYPPQRLITNQSICRIAELKNLFTVFERC